MGLKNLKNAGSHRANIAVVTPNERDAMQPHKDEDLKGRDQAQAPKLTQLGRTQLDDMQKVEMAAQALGRAHEHGERRSTGVLRIAPNGLRSTECRSQRAGRALRRACGQHGVGASG